MEKIAKQDIIDFEINYSDNNYVVVYKRTGEDTSIPRVEKPIITPVSVNRDDQTDFLLNLSEDEVKDITVFLNFEKDIKNSSVGNVDFYIKKI